MHKKISLWEFINLSDIDIENKILIYPTDTVYGLGGDPFDILSTMKVLHLKGRFKKPFPILISDYSNAIKLANVGRISRLFADRYWPGKLTILFPARIRIPSLLNSRYVGLRIPGDENVINLIKKIGGFIIGTSANLSGYPPALTCEDAYQYFKESVDLYICNDDIIGGIPSSVVSIDEEKKIVYILREGAISIDEISLYCREVGCNVSMSR